MRIITRLRIVSIFTLVVLAILGTVLVGSYLNFVHARNNSALASAIKTSFFERSSLRDRYFINREKHIAAQWDKNKEASDSLIQESLRQITDADGRTSLDEISRNIEDSAMIFHRIVKNTEMLKAAGNGQALYDELDRRLSSQLLVKASEIRDRLMALEASEHRKLESTFIRLTVYAVLFSVTLALSTLLTLVFAGRLFRRRLLELHDGAKIISGGNLNYRISQKGSDELTELGDSINDMTDKLQRFTRQLEEEINERKLAENKISELNRHLEQRVAERTSQLESSNHELEAFSYSISHDLRTPLRAIDGFSRIVLDNYADKLDDEGRRLLHVVRDNTTRMGQLIDDILQFSRTGRLEINVSAIDMERLARTAFEEIRPSVDVGNLQLKIGPLPPAKGDSAMLHQVFVNLLSNAIKFSRTNASPKIEAGGAVEGNEAVYFVRDNGVGFDMKYADKLFGVFQRLHAVNEFEGTGIGLAIVKRIITRHGGRVWAEGKVNEGATIYFALPT